VTRRAKPPARVEPDETTLAEAEDGLRWVLGDLGINTIRDGWEYHVPRVARVVAVRTVNAGGGLWVPLDKHQAALRDEQDKTDRHRRAWAHATKERDQTLTRVQTALDNLAAVDPVLADELAAAFGVQLTPQDPPAAGDGPHTQPPAGNNGEDDDWW
jgi:hypothetical protein